MVACPFGVPELYDDRKIMMKCDMCYDRTSVGRKPMCATVCPSQALFFGTREQIEQLRPLSAPINTFRFGNQTITTQVQVMVPRAVAARASFVDVVAAMEDAIQKAARSRYGAETDIRAEINPKTGEIKLQRLLKVVEAIENPSTDILVEDARRLDQITFEEMLEMASLGSKVLQIRSVEFAGKYRVKTRVLSSLTDPLMPLEQEMHSGTLITFEEESEMEAAVISGIAFARDEAKITVLGVPDKPGIAYQILGPIADANIDVDMIIQNQSVDGKTDFTFTVPRADYQRALAILDDGVKTHIGAGSVSGDPKVSKVSVVGVGMRSHVGIASKMFRTLSEEGINIQMISTSEIKISVLIDEKYMELAVRALHKAFELEQA